MRITGDPIATTSSAHAAGRSTTGTTGTTGTTSTIRTMTSVGPGARIRPALHGHDPNLQDLTEDTDPRNQDGGTRRRSDRTGDHTRRHTCPVT